MRKTIPHSYSNFKPPYTTWNTHAQHLKGRHFYLYSDHKPITKLSAVHTKMLNRLQTLLTEYLFTIRHIPRKQKTVADFLSRHPLPSTPPRATVSAIDTSPATLLELQERDPELREVLRAYDPTSTTITARP